MKYTINNYMINSTEHTDRAWSHVISYPELFLHWWVNVKIALGLTRLNDVSVYTATAALTWKEGSERERNLLSSPVYPSSGVSVDVDQNQTFHCIWVCELRRESRSVHWQCDTISHTSIFTAHVVKGKQTAHRILMSEIFRMKIFADII